MRISSPRSRRCLGAPPATPAQFASFKSFAVLLVLACTPDTPRFIEPPVPLGARSSAAKSKLTVNGTGSTAGGTAVSSRGGISCTISMSAGAPRATGKCSQDFNTGTSLTVTATPAGNAVLSGWTGCTAAAENPLSCEVTMDQARTVSAIFAPAPTTHVLTISGGAGGNGRVTSSPAGINCTITSGTAGATGCAAPFPVGQSVTLSAVASTGSYLKSWAGDGCEARGTGVGGSSGSCMTTMSQSRTIAVAFDLPATVASLGEWDAPISWPGIAIHAHVLPDGRVMTWGRMDRPPVFWNPTTRAFGSSSHPVDFFCSGHAFLPDGRLLTSGGHSGVDNQGIRSSAVFDFATNSWTTGASMRNGRWYPTTTTLASGEILTVSGGDTIQQRNLIPEVYQADGTWRELSTASLFLPYYPFMFVAPNGLVFAAGPSPTTFWLDPTGTGKWTNGPRSAFGVRDYGSAVMYDAGKILIMGGNPTNVAPTRTAEVIDLNAGAGAVWRSVGSMSVGRRQINATLLANGQVLVTGGSNGTGFNAPPTSDAVLAAELWDPATEQWKTLARMGHHRLYHSTAVLLPDARVLTAGSGQPAALGFTDDYTAEIFNPPYLFNADGTLATRPAITSAPTAVGYSQAFTVSTPDAADVREVTWIRLGSVTHAFDESQRLNRLTFSVSSATSLLVNAPARGALAPPGHYMLFILDSRGVPSLAKVVRIS